LYATIQVGLAWLDQTRAVGVVRRQLHDIPQVTTTVV